MKKIYGLLGYPLGHSFSRGFFTEKFKRENIDAEYLNFEFADVNEILDIITKTPNIKGFNITIPHKLNIIHLLDNISPEAKAIGAVNCVKIEDGILLGYNTDVIGFKKRLLEFIGNDRPSALVLGTGGASRAVKYVLSELGIAYRVVSRVAVAKESILSYDMVDAEIISTHKLIINTTPLGTFPKVEDAPAIPYHLLTPEHKLYDLVYNPTTTKFMQNGKDMGAQSINGYGMLVGQALAAWEIWN